MRRLFYLCAIFLPSLAMGGGTVTATKGTGTVTSSKGAGIVIAFNGYQPPGNFRYTASSSNTLTVQWNDALNPSATGYTLQLSTASDYTGTIISSVTQMTISTLTALSVNALYYARIKSEYAGSISSIYSSNITTATLTVVPVTLASTWTVTTTTVTMVWARGDNPANVTSYTVDLSTVSGFGSGTTTSSTTFMVSSTFTSLASGGTYYVRVLSTNLSGIKSSYLQLGSTNTITSVGFTVVQASCSATANTTSTTLTLTGVTVGNTLMAFNSDGADGYVSVSDGANTYTDWAAGGIANAGSRTIIYVSTNIGTGGTRAIVVTAGSGANTNGCVAEVSGVTAVTAYATNSQAATSAITTGNMVTLEQDICFGVMTHSTGGTFTITPAGTQIGTDPDNSAHQAYNVQYSTLGAGTNVLTWTTGSLVTPVSMGMCLK